MSTQPHCYLPEGFAAGGEILLPADESRHLLQSLRLRPGDTVMVFDGCGAAGAAAVVGTRGGRLVVQVRTVRAVPAPPVSLTLFQALPKGDRMDWIVQKATELGVAAIQPLVTAHVVVRLAAARASGRGVRWGKIAVQAAQQCRRAWVPRVLPLQDLAAAAGAVAAYDLFLVASLEAAAVSLRVRLDEMRRGPCRPARVAMLVGPEGDLTAEEYATLRAAGAQAVSFGATVLRVETAALYGLSVLAYELLP